MSMRNVSKPVGSKAVWSAHLQTTFKKLGIPSGTIADNLAESLALFCDTYYPRGVKASDMALLTARCFCAVGEQESAERVLSSLKPHSLHVKRWIEILTELHQFPELLPYFSSGVIRPADWAGAELDRMWTLDFSLLTPQETDQHEITLYRMIRAMIEKMLPFWDGTNGTGVLGIKSIKTLHLPAKKTKREKQLTAPDELLTYISDILKQAAKQRNWDAVPSVLNLDL